jgi:hypothetical protein
MYSNVDVSLFLFVSDVGLAASGMTTHRLSLETTDDRRNAPGFKSLHVALMSAIARRTPSSVRREIFHGGEFLVIPQQLFGQGPKIHPF